MQGRIELQQERGEQAHSGGSGAQGGGSCYYFSTIKHARKWELPVPRAFSLAGSEGVGVELVNEEGVIVVGPQQESGVYRRRAAQQQHPNNCVDLAFLFAHTPS